MRILVVGGNGFIGSHVVDALAARGHEIAVLDRFGIAAPQWSAPGVELIDGDMLDQATAAHAVAGCDAVVQCVALSYPSSGEEDILLEQRTTVPGTVTLFQEAVFAGVSTLAFISSGGTVYGETAAHDVSETDVLAPLSPYGISKVTIEGYLRYFRQTYGVSTVSFRLSNPFGLRQNPHRRQGVIPVMLRDIVRESAVTVMGDGSMVRDYIFVEDAARMIATALSTGCGHEVYNIGRGQGMSIHDVLKEISRAIGFSPRVQFVQAPATVVSRSVLDISRYAAEFGQPEFADFGTVVEQLWSSIVEEERRLAATGTKVKELA